jgi:alkylation response protein AidB-like acyl-CoA dehydrogenase
MKILLSNEQRSIQRAVHEFTKGEFDEDTIPELLKKGRFPEKIWKKACELGFIGLCYPEEYGGQSCDMMDQTLVIEEMCRKDSSVGIALGLADMGAELICFLGSTDQKKKYLSRIAKGKLLSVAIFPDTDQNNACISKNLKLIKESDGFRLNGNANYVFNADLAGLFVIQCSGDDGECFVLLDKETPGVSVDPIGSKLGINMLSWQKVYFDHVKVGDEAIMPVKRRESLEDYQLQRLLKVCSMYLGIAQGAYDQALAYSKQREQFRQKIAEFQGIRHKLVDMYRELKAARCLVYHTGIMMDKGQADISDMTVAKLQAEHAALHVSYEALQIFGGTVYMIEIPIEHYYRDARMMQTLTGRSIFQKDRIAQFIIGKMNG